MFVTSFDCNDPAYVHVERENSTHTFWLEPIELARNQGFSARELNAIRRPINTHRAAILEAWHERRGQYRAAHPHVRVTEDEIIARLADGRVTSAPLAWSWRLSEATPKQRAHFRLIGTGQGAHWPNLDEDIIVEGMLHGVPTHRPRAAAATKRGGPVRDQEPPNNHIQLSRVTRCIQPGGRRARG